MRHTTRCAPVAVLFALLSLSQIQQSVARVGILWRTSVLSWDNPATQDLEDIATETVSLPAFEWASASLVVVARPLRDARPVRSDPVDAPALSARISRSPPGSPVSGSIWTESAA
jgi:hypothetical protein